MFFQLFKSIAIPALACILSIHGADKFRIAVYPLEARNGVEAPVAANVTDLLQTELSRLNRFEVLERANLQRVIKEQALQNSGCSESACAVKLGNLLNVQKMVVGSVFRLGTEIFLNISFINVELGRVEISDKVSAASEKDLPAAVEKLAQSVKARTPLMARVIQLESSNVGLCNFGAEDGVKKEDRVLVTRQGEALVDPGTGALLGRRIQEIGEAVVDTLMGPTVVSIRAQRQISLKMGDLVNLIVANSATGDTTTPTTSPSPVSTPVPEAIFTITTNDQRPLKSKLRLAGGITMGVGALGIAAGVLLSAEYQTAYNQYKNATGDFANLYAKAQGLYDGALVSSITGYSLAGAGAVVLLTGILLPNQSEKRVQVSVLPTWDGVRLTAFFRLP